MTVALNVYNRVTAAMSDRRPALVKKGLLVDLVDPQWRAHKLPVDGKGVPPRQGRGTSPRGPPRLSSSAWWKP